MIVKAVADGDGDSTTLDCTHKFSNFIGSYRAVRKLSDLICAEYRLSVIENPQKHGLSYNKWLGVHDKLTNRDLLRMAIDAALEKKPQDFDALLTLSIKTVGRPKLYIAFQVILFGYNIYTSSPGGKYKWKEDI